MQKMILFVLIISLSMFMSYCNSLFPDEKLTMQRGDYEGNELKIDGYYYRQEVTEVSSRTMVMFLYRNGILLSCGSFSTIDLNIVVEELPNRYTLVEEKQEWMGRFSIDKNLIQTEQWVESPSGASSSIYRRSGYIENDTTIHFTESYYSGRNEAN
ncbi:hypothetical protein AGMMS4957_13170 [Bacteroidia bacterium]|nr:hypothetical protein AGMMS4957_13170 [Bacteroidia bacterium]